MNATRAWGWIVVGAVAIGCGGSGGSDSAPGAGTIASGTPGPYQGSGSQNPFAPSGSGGPFAGSSNPGPFNGGGTTSGGNGGGSVDPLCTETCAIVGAAGCQDVTRDSCLVGCPQELADPQCGALAAALFECLKTATLSCSSKGKLKVEGCNSAILAYANCTAPPQPGGNDGGA